MAGAAKSHATGDMISASRLISPSEANDL